MHWFMNNNYKSLKCDHTVMAVVIGIPHSTYMVNHYHSCSWIYTSSCPWLLVLGLSLLLVLDLELSYSLTWLCTATVEGKF